MKTATALQARCYGHSGLFHRNKRKLEPKGTKFFVYGSNIVVETKAKLLKG